MQLFPCCILVFLLVQALPAVELLSEQAAKNRLFLGADEVVIQRHELTQAQIEEVRRICGGEEEHGGPDADNPEEKRAYTFYVGMKQGKEIGIALVEEQHGRWGPMKFMVLIDPAFGTIKDGIMLSYTDARASHLSGRPFMRSLIGKSVRDSAALGRDIHAVSGATVSSAAACFIFRKALALYQVVFDKSSAVEEGPVRDRETRIFKRKFTRR